MQTSSTHYTAFGCAVNLYSEGGLLAFYKGFWPPFLAQGSYKAVVFSSYVLAKIYLFNGKQCFESFFTSGLIAGSINSVIVAPVELIRTHQILDTSKTPLQQTMFARISDIRRKNGIFGLWRGFLSTVLRDGPGLGFYFISFEYLKNNLPFGPQDIRTKLIAGSLAGINYWIYAVPLDTIKTRIQSPYSTNSSLVENIKLIYLEGGFLGMYKMLPVALARGVPGAAITLTTFDMTSDFLRNL